MAASAFENFVGATVVIGGAAGLVYFGIAALVIAISGKDDFFEERSITYSTSTEETFVVESQSRRGKPIIFIVPASPAAVTVEMAIVEPKWAQPDELSDIGYRHANLVECRTFLDQLRASGKNISYDMFMCFGSASELGGSSYRAGIQYFERDSVYKIIAYNEQQVHQFSHFTDRQYLAVKE